MKKGGINAPEHKKMHRPYLPCEFLFVRLTLSRKPNPCPPNYKYNDTLIFTQGELFVPHVSTCVWQFPHKWHARMTFVKLHASSTVFMKNYASTNYILTVTGLLLKRKWLCIAAFGCLPFRDSQEQKLPIRLYT